MPRHDDLGTINSNFHRSCSQPVDNDPRQPMTCGKPGLGHRTDTVAAEIMHGKARGAFSGQPVTVYSDAAAGNHNPSKTVKKEHLGMAIRSRAHTPHR